MIQVQSIVVYSYLGVAVYFDGKLVRYYSEVWSGHCSWEMLCTLLGIQLVWRSVRWEDMLSVCKEGNGDKLARRLDGKTRLLNQPPEDLSTVEEHFRKLNIQHLKDQRRAIQEDLAKVNKLLLEAGVEREEIW